MPNMPKPFADAISGIFPLTFTDSLPLMTNHHQTTSSGTPEVPDMSMHEPEARKTTGRFAPSPTGRMHLGNVAAALLSWLCAKSAGGDWVLRIEDLDQGRSRQQYIDLLRDDLHWLGLEADQGADSDICGPAAPYRQSMRHDLYRSHLETIQRQGLTYPCTCRRADILATQAPHQSDGRVVYAGTCRPESTPPFSADGNPRYGMPHSTRLFVPDRDIVFTDTVYGRQCVNLAHDCGDFILRRADGAWAYQLAVVVDDATMGITQVVRGNDLLLSAAQQIYLYELLGYPAPQFVHIPLLCNSTGQRLSKRDGALSMEALRRDMTAQQLLGRLAHLLGLRDSDSPVTAPQLLDGFSPAKIPAVTQIKI